MEKACTQPLDSTQTTYVNLGLFSAMHKLHGVGINAFGSMVQNDMNGVQISGSPILPEEVCVAYKLEVSVT